LKPKPIIARAQANLDIDEVIAYYRGESAQQAGHPQLDGRMNSGLDARHANHPSGRWAKWRALSAADQRTLLAAALWMPLFWLGLRVLGLPRFQARLQRSKVKRHAAMALPDIQTLGSLVNIAARHTLGPHTCLTRSLLLGWLLRRHGVESQLRIGVRLNQGALDAHAWVECDGVPVNDQPDVGAQFASFGDLVPLAAFDA